jgi:hypothetical protein
MKTQQSILERARRGDPEAIACLMNNSLNSQHITAKVSVETDCLRIMLEAADVPDQQAMLSFIQEGMIRLGAASIKTVQIYGRQSVEEVPAWEARLNLTNSALPSSQDLSLLVEQTRQNFNRYNPTDTHKAKSRFTFTTIAAIGTLIALNLLLGFRSIFQLSGESRAYANDAILGIVSSWNTSALVDRASPKLLQSDSQLSLKQSFSRLSKELGGLQKYHEVSCNVNSTLTQMGNLTTSKCNTILTFEKASATVEVQLSRQGNQWQIDRFQVNSETSN